MRARWPLTKRKMDMNERLTDEELRATVVAALRGQPDTVWKRFTHEHGIYEITRLNVSTELVCRAIESAVLARAAVPAPTADVDAWARARWPGHQLHDNGKDTPLMVLIRDVWRAARAAVPVVQQEPVAWRFKERINGEFDSDWILTTYEPADGVRIIAKEPLYTARGVLASPNDQPKGDA